MTTLPDEILLSLFQNLDVEELQSICALNKRLWQFCQEKSILNKIMDLKIFPGKITSVIKNGTLYVFGINNYVLPYLELDPPINKNCKMAFPVKNEKEQTFSGLHRVILPESMGTPEGVYALSDHCYFLYNTKGEVYVLGDGKLGCLGTGTMGNRRKWTKLKGISGKVIDMKGNYYLIRHPTEAKMIRRGVMGALTEEGDFYYWGLKRDNTLNMTPQLIPSDKKWMDFTISKNGGRLLSEEGDIYLWNTVDKEIFPPNFPPRNKVVQIAGSLYLDEEGKVFIGRIISGKINKIPVDQKLVPTDDEDLAEETPTLLFTNRGGPAQYELVKKEPFTEKIISIGSVGTSVFLTENGEVYTQGYENRGALGYRIGKFSGTLNTPYPTLLELPEPVVSISINSSTFNTTIGVITENNRIFFWGNSSFWNIGSSYPYEILLD